VGITETVKVSEVSVVFVDPSEIKVNSRFRRDLGNLEDLKRSVASLGLLQPIGITRDKTLVFGERRLRACVELGLKRVPCVFVDGDLYRLKLAELHENIRRKNMTWQEEVLAVEELKQIYEKIYGWNSNSGRPMKNRSSDDRFSTNKLARELKISKGKIVQDLQLAAAIKKYPEIRECRKKTEALRKLRRIKREKKIVKKVEAKVPDDVVLIEGDFKEVGDQIPDESVNLILTDPPYGSQHLDLWDALGEFANRVLISGGWLIAYSGQYHLKEFIEKLEKHLKYFWVIALQFPKNYRHMPAPLNVINTWKPILIFYKPPLNSPAPFTDLILGSGMEKDLHPWQQSVNEIKVLVETFSYPRSVVLDPMAGTGTTLVAAYSMGRKCIGIELDHDNFLKIKERLSHVENKE